MALADPDQLDAGDVLAARASPAGFAWFADGRNRTADPELGWLPFPHLTLLSDKLMQVAAGQVRRLIVTMPPRHGKPVYDGAMVLMGDGSRRELREVRPGDTVITHLGQPRTVDAVHEQGDLPSVTITTASGRSTIAALDHPFLTPEGWVNAGDLQAGMTLATVAAADIDTGETREEAEYRLAGYFVGDGNTAASAGSFAATITCFDPLQADDIRACAHTLGFVVRETIPGRLSFSAQRWRDPDGIRPWLARVGLARKTSHTKRVPDFVFTAPSHHVAHFLAGYFECDGHINRRGSARRDAALEFYSVNRDLLKDVQHLMLRLGVRSSLRVKRSAHNTYVNGPHESWRLTITSQDDVAKLAERLPLRGAKASVLADWGVRRGEFDRRLLPDVVVSVEPVGKRPCRCLTVAEDHTFTADDLVVHNSQLISQFAPAWYLGSFPRRKVMIASNTATLAEDFSRKARDALVEYGPAVFGVAVRTDTSAAARWELTRGGVCIAAGVGGPLTGRGAHLLIIDDPIKNDKEAMSQTIREAHWNWWKGTARTRLQKGGCVVVVQTRWHEDDLAGRMLAQMQAVPGADQWEVLNLPAFPEADEDTGEIDDPLGRAEGEALCPDLMPASELATTRAELGSYHWGALYQQHPRPAEGLLFKAHHFAYYRGWTPDLARDAVVHVEGADDTLTAAGLDHAALFQTVDVAASEKESSDYTVISTWAVTADRDLLLVDRQRRQFDVLDVGGFVETAYHRWLPSFVSIERLGHGLTVIQELVRKGLPIRRLEADRDKVARALVAVARYEEGRVFHPREAPWLAEWEDELLAFPTGRNDDQVDTVAYAARELPGVQVGAGRKQRDKGRPSMAGMRTKQL